MATAPRPLLPALLLALAALPAAAQAPAEARNAILFVGDGMGVSTVTATRLLSVGADGRLAMDDFPFTALSRTASTDTLTADSAATMSAMITGVNTNNGVLSLPPESEPGDFNADGDGPPSTTLLELAHAAGKRVGVVTTARVTHATPAAAYAHANHRDAEDALALAPLPGDPAANPALPAGLDLLAGGGRRHFLPRGVRDEEGEPGARRDGRDLRADYRDAGFHYVWNAAQWSALTADDLPVLALFASTHMEYEYDRLLDVGGEPSLEELTTRAVALLEADAGDAGWVLVVESGRIDHAHHGGNAYRALVETETFDRAVEAACAAVDLADTLIVVTADHSHGFVLAGYPLRARDELPYAPRGGEPGWDAPGREPLLDLTWHLDARTGRVRAARDRHGVPYTPLLYATGPGARPGPRRDPREDAYPGFHGALPRGPADPAYRQEAHVPLGSETHGGEDVAVYAVGAGARRLHGTVPNTAVFELLRHALGL